MKYKSSGFCRDQGPTTLSTLQGCCFDFKSLCLWCRRWIGDTCASNSNTSIIHNSSVNISLVCCHSKTSCSSALEYRGENSKVTLPWWIGFCICEEMPSSCHQNKAWNWTERERGGESFHLLCLSSHNQLVIKLKTRFKGKFCDEEFCNRKQTKFLRWKRFPPNLPWDGGWWAFDGDDGDGGMMLLVDLHCHLKPLLAFQHPQRLARPSIQV